MRPPVRAMLRRLRAGHPLGTAAVQLLPSPAEVLCTIRNLGPMPVRLIDATEQAVLVIRPGMTVQCSSAWAAPPAEPPASIVASSDGGDRLSLAALRAAAQQQTADRAERQVDGLRLIGWHGCEHYTGRHNCRTAGSGKTRDGRYAGEQWCDACIALDALGIEPGTRPREDGWYGLSAPQRN